MWLNSMKRFNQGSSIKLTDPGFKGENSHKIFTHSHSFGHLDATRHSEEFDKQILSGIFRSRQEESKSGPSIDINVHMNK